MWTIFNKKNKNMTIYSLISKGSVIQLQNLTYINLEQHKDTLKYKKIRTKEQHPRRTIETLGIPSSVNWSPKLKYCKSGPYFTNNSPHNVKKKSCEKNAIKTLCEYFTESAMKILFWDYFCNKPTTSLQ